MTRDNTISSDFMGTIPIPKLLLRFSIPAIISTTTNCLYNIVDRLYIGRSVGPDAQAGLSLTFPYMLVLMAFGMLVGQGSAAVVSILLGQQKKEDANKVLGQAIALFLLFCLTFQAIGLVYLDEILKFLGGTPKAIPYAHSYMSIILWGSIFQHMSFGLSNVVRSEGCSKQAMFIIILGAVCNIILDPIFIFVFKQGIAGAAIATVLSMMISSSWVLCHFLWGKSVLRLHLRNIRIYPRLFIKVLSIGMAPCIMQIVHSLVVYAYNKCFNYYGTDEAEITLALGAFGIINSIIMCLLMPAFGIMQGTQPIIGYNYGAKLFDRVTTAFRLALKLAFGLSICIAIISYILAPAITSCFSKTNELIEMSTTALRAATAGFSFISLGMLTVNYFQAIGKAPMCLFLSLSRQCIILIPILVFLPHFLGFQSIWWAGSISDFLSGVMAIIFYSFEARKMHRQMTAL